MSTAEQRTAPDPPLLFVGQQDTSRLLEVYVKRSLSLNDGSLRTADGRQRKSVSQAERRRRLDRMHSSDTSLHLSVDKEDGDDSAFVASSGDPVPPGEPQTGDKTSRQRWNTLRTRWKSFRDKGKRPMKHPKVDLVVKPSASEGKAKEPEAAASDLESSTEKPKATPKRGRKPGHKKPKPSFWKNIIGFFSRADSDTEERDPSPVRTVDTTQPDELPTPPATCLPLPKAPPEGEEGSPRRRKSTKRRRSVRKRLSLKLDRPSSLVVEVVERVETTDSYYENVSEELKKIVTEVKESPTDEHAPFPPGPLPAENNRQSLSAEEVVERLIYLIKQEGDVLNAKIQMEDSPSFVSFFQALTYGSFQQLADQYVQSEIPEQPVQDPVVAPELVKLAFTLDFTARLASLSRQSPSHIMGLGNRYLQDRFTYLTEAQPMTPTAELAGPGDVGSSSSTHT